MANRYWRQFFYSFTNQLVGLHGSASLVVPVQASVVSQGVTYTAVPLGALGNGITVTVVGGGTAGAEVVTVVGTAVQIQVENGVSTRTQLKTAWDASAAALALATTSVVSGATTVTATAVVTLASGVSGVASISMKGVDSITRTAAGTFSMVLSDTYYGGLESIHITLIKAAAQDLVAQVVSQDVSGTGIIIFKLLTGATPTDVLAAASLSISMRLNNSTVV